MPIFRSLEDDFSSFFNDVDKLFSAGNTSVRTYQPRFDVREEKDAYHLHGELPGANPENLQVEFVDRNTMVVRGRTVRESQRGNPPKAVEGDKEPDTTMSSALPTAQSADAMEAESTATTQADRPGTPDSTSSNYHKATVEEDQDDFVDVRSETAGAEQATAEAAKPEQTPAQQTEKAAEQQQQQPTTKPKQRESHYWVSERSVGEFHRSFRFPGQIDQDNVKASLKDGVLNVVVPKVAEQGPRRINVE